jgi:SAM-dependent methyltransferase/uncharacterized protein YbaR (Trm112 family)
VTIEPDLLAVLRCPYCGNRLSFRVSRTPQLGAAEFGLLDCGCRLHPVVDGIPILLQAPVGAFEHTSGAAAHQGATPAQLVELIRSGREGEALSRCLSHATTPPLPLRLLGWRLSHSEPAARLTRWLHAEQLRATVLSRRNRISACDALRFFFQADSPLGEAVGDYFVMRFGQPRHLAALALLGNLPAGPKPILDIGCGTGHIDHFLTRRREAGGVVGLDVNFFQLWIARHWIAPRAAFVCCDVHDGLPFADDVFGATFCCDAYHYLRDRQALLREVERCAPGRMAVLTRVGNASHGPNEGQELSVQGYRDEIAAGTLRVFDEISLVRDYLARRNPLARPADDLEEAQDSKWLSFAWNAPREVRTPPWDESAWPHAVGSLGLNPIYVPTRLGDGAVELRFRFPGIWFAFENAAILTYQPRSLTLSRSDVARLDRGASDPLTADLIRKFVLLGMPERYTERTGLEA